MKKCLLMQSAVDKQPAVLVLFCFVFKQEHILL